VKAALNGPAGQFMLGPGSITIGRGRDNSIALDDSQASSRHAEIHPQGEGYVITDLGSTNGTFINSQRLTPNVPHELQPNDFIRIGSTEFTYQTYGVGGNPLDDATVANPNAWSTPNYAPTIGIPPAPQPPNYNPNAGAYPPPTNYPPGYPPPAPDYPNYGTPPQQPYAPPVQPGQYNAYGQSGTTSPGLPVQPAPARKSRVGLWIGLIVLLLLIIIAAAGAFWYVNRSTPAKTLQAYCTALQDDNAQDAYNQLSSRIQSQITLQRYISSFNTAERLLNSPLLGGIKNCAVTNVQESGSSATGTVVLTVNNSARTFSFPTSLIDENGTWKINSTVRTPTS
jgi:pSer/pThr/pTyr-binding forkhead associated (FHA) protein/uncharacterized membrane protein